MNKTDKIIIGSSIIVAASTITMIMISKKCNTITSNLLSELQDIHQNMNDSHQEIIDGNKELVKSNQLLRRLVIESAKNKIPK